MGAHRQTLSEAGYPRSAFDARISLELLSKVEFANIGLRPSKLGKKASTDLGLFSEDWWHSFELGHQTLIPQSARSRVAWRRAAAVRLAPRMSWVRAKPSVSGPWVLSSLATEMAGRPGTGRAGSWVKRGPRV